MSTASNGKNNGGVTGKGFKKGQSGNPRGRPRDQDNLRVIVRDFLSERDRSMGQARLRVVLKRLYLEKPEVLLHYGWGKPVETHDMNISQEIAGVDQAVVEALRKKFLETVSK